MRAKTTSGRYRQSEATKPISPKIFVLAHAPIDSNHGTRDPVAPKADRDGLEAEMDGAGANWQMLDFGGRLHSFAEEETMLKGRAEFNAPAARQTYRMLDDFIQDAFNKNL